MIEFRKKIKINSHQIQDIFCCSCIFDKLVSLLFSSEEEAICYFDFVSLLKKDYSKDKFVFFTFSSIFLLICKSTIKFILENKKICSRLMRKSCITDLVEIENESIVLYNVCFLQIIERNDLLPKFKLKNELRNDGYFFL